MYTPPTTTEIEAQIIGRIETALGQTVPILPVAFVRILAAALAAPLSLLYRVIAWAMRQIFPQTADAESLVYLGGQYGLVRTPSVAAQLTITVSGDDGTSVPAGTLWISGSNVYAQSALGTIAGGIATVIVRSLVSGDSANISVGAALTPATPITGVVGAVVASVSTLGANEETLEAFRSRVIDRMRYQPQGGSAADYVQWAREVSGIVAAFAYRVGTDVVVYPLLALSGSGRVPDAAKLAEVQSYLQAPERRPLCATVYAQGATERTVDVTITGLSPSGATTKANITAAIEAYFYARYPRQYSDEPLATDVLAVAAIWAAIFAENAVASAVSMTVSGIGTATTYTLPAGEIAKLGSVTWA